MPNEQVALLVVGAGPAGLTAAYEAQKAGFATLVAEKDSRYVGGISRTVEYHGYRFDIGGHRFFSKSSEVTRWWKERLPGDFIKVRRMSRILYRKRFFDYPLRPWNALRGLGVFNSVLCVASYGLSRLRPIRPEKSFADWVTNRFGKRLFSIFFKTYTEKVWGIPTQELSADWAAQRIKGLSLSKAIINAFRGKSASPGKPVIKTLIDTFEYPRLGPGQMWERAAADFETLGGCLKMGATVTRFLHANGRVTAAELTQAGRTFLVEAKDYIVSMPLKETILAFDPPLPAEVCSAAAKLRYRDFITVALIVEGENPFPDNWIYIHDGTVKLGRIQNFKNWSEALVGKAGTTCLGLEYFCSEGDDVWSLDDSALIDLGKCELAKLGLARAEQITDGAVVRVPKAYPVYDPGYSEQLRVIRRALGEHAQNLQVVGRNGMHKYNNQDHSMMTAMLAAKNLQGGTFNLWNVNTDAEYHEEVQRPAPHLTSA
jgi:protoporphyrinogen oxidase